MRSITRTALLAAACTGFGPASGAELELHVDRVAPGLPTTIWVDGLPPDTSVAFFTSVDGIAPSACAPWACPDLISPSDPIVAVADATGRASITQSPRASLSDGDSLWLQALAPGVSSGSGVVRRTALVCDAWVPQDHVTVLDLVAPAWLGTPVDGCVSEGVYEALNVQLTDADVSIRGQGPGVTILEGYGGTWPIEVTDTDLLLTGLTIRNGGDGGVSLDHRGSDSTSVTLEDLHLVGNGGEGLQLYLNSSSSDMELTMDRVWSVGNAGPGMGVYSDLRYPREATVSVVDSAFAHNEGRGINFGFATDYVSSLSLAGVDVWDNGGGGITASVWLDASHLRVIDNHGADKGGGLHTTYYTDLAYSVFAGNSALEGGGIYTDAYDSEFHHLTVIGNDSLLGAESDAFGGDPGGDSALHDAVVAEHLGVAVGFYESYPRFEVTHSDFWNNGSVTSPVSWWLGPVASEGNFMSDPMFTDTTSSDPWEWDLSPLLGSPLLDAGRVGFLDPDGSPSDVGAHVGGGQGFRCDNDPSCEADCSDGLDEDMDGRFDCADIDCALEAHCQESVCGDGFDDDGDGRDDCDEYECLDAMFCVASDPIEDCAVAGDEDADGLVDCADPDCDATCVEDCFNGYDDNGDGLADCDDPKCTDTCASPAVIIDATSARTLVIGEPGDSFGAAVSGAGDTDGDGRDEWMASAPDRYPDGMLAVFRGDSPGTHPIGSADVVFEKYGSFYASWSGLGATSIGSVGDLDADGFDDLVASYGGRDGGIGAAYLFYGDPDPAAFDSIGAYGPYDYTFHTDTSAFGYSVGGVGDLDGDGKTEAWYSASEFEHVPAFDGGVYFWNGSDPQWSIVGGSSGTAAGPGDLDGDGHVDLVVGIGDGTYVFYGPIVAADTHVAFADAAFTAGSTVDELGDTDGDGRPDFLVTTGAESFVIPGARYSGFFLDIHASIGSVDGVTDARGVGDLNGDGLGDLAVGVDEGVCIFLGPVIGRRTTDKADLCIENSGPAAGFGWSFDDVGDIDGDGRTDLVIGAPDALSGRGQVGVFSGADLFAPP